MVSSTVGLERELLVESNSKEVVDEEARVGVGSCDSDMDTGTALLGESVCRDKLSIGVSSSSVELKVEVVNETSTRDALGDGAGDGVVSCKSEEELNKELLDNSNSTRVTDGRT